MGLRRGNGRPTVRVASSTGRASMVLASILLSGCAASGRATPTAERRDAPAAAASTLDDIARGEVGERTPGFSLALIHEGRVQQVLAWGEDALGSGRPLRGDELYPLPDLVPVMLAAVAMGLDRSGQLPADRPVGEVVDGLAAGAAAVTVAQLLNGTSGLDNAQPRDDRDWEGQLALLGAGAVTAPPGEVYSQSRYHLPLLAHVVERVLDRPLDEILRVAVLDPLGMTRSVVGPSAEVVPGYRWVPDQGLQRVETPPDPVEPLPMLHTTPREAALFFAALLRGDLGLDPAALTPRVPPHYGEGTPRIAWITRIDMDDGSLRYAVPVRSTGYWGQVYGYPSAGTGVVVLGTGRTAPMSQNAIDRVIAGLATGVPPDRVRVPQPVRRRVRSVAPPVAGPDWAGTYRNGDLLVVLRLIDGQLHYWDGRESIPLVTADDGSLYLDGPAAGTLLPVETASGRYMFFQGMMYAWDPDSAPDLPPGG